MLSQDPNLSEQEKIKMYNVAQNAQTQYNMFRSTLQNEKALAEYYKGNEDIANGTAFQLSDDIAFRAMIDSHSFETKLDENGNIIIRGAKSPLSNEYKDYTLGEAVALMSKRPEKDLLNGKGGFLDQLFNDGEKMKQSWSSDTTGFKTTSWTKFSEENGGKYFDTVFGEYSPNYIDPRLKQYARQILQKDIESKKDFDELKKSVINYMSTAVPTSSKVDVARPTVVNVNNGGGGGNSQQGGFYNSANATVKVQVKDNNGKVLGVRDQEMRVLTLPKLKGQPSTDNVFGLTEYKGKDGKSKKAYYLGAPAKDGTIVTSRISEQELTSYGTKLGYSPAQILKFITDNSRNETIPFQEKPNKYSFSDDNIYKGVKISFKSKELEEQEQQQPQASFFQSVATQQK